MARNVDMLQLQIAAQCVQVDVLAPVEERLRQAMRIVRDPVKSRDVFWMTSGSQLDDDFRMRTAIAAVLIVSNKEEQDLITRSLVPLKALSDMLAGRDLDPEALLPENLKGLIPLVRLWHEEEPKP